MQFLASTRRRRLAVVMEIQPWLIRNIQIPHSPLFKTEYSGLMGVDLPGTSIFMPTIVPPPGGTLTVYTNCHGGLKILPSRWTRTKLLPIT